MVKQHLKRLASPKTWGVKKKNITFITRPNPGPHKINYQMPINVILRDLIGVVKTTKEAKFILHNKDCLIDQIMCHDYRRPAGIMDVISILSTGKNYRMSINTKNTLVLNEINEKESKLKLVKIKSKTNLKQNKVQLNCTDGRNILVDDIKKYAIGDSLLIELPTQKIQEHIKLENKALVLLVSGTHVGEVGVVENVDGKLITIKMEKGTYTTKKDFAFVLGNGKPVINI